MFFTHFTNVLVVTLLYGSSGLVHSMEEGHPAEHPANRGSGDIPPQGTIVLASPGDFRYEQPSDRPVRRVNYIVPSF